MFDQTCLQLYSNRIIMEWMNKDKTIIFIFKPFILNSKLKNEKKRKRKKETF